MYLLGLSRGSIYWGAGWFIRVGRVSVWCSVAQQDAAWLRNVVVVAQLECGLLSRVRRGSVIVRLGSVGCGMAQQDAAWLSW
jgi:hypothetical protein